MRIANVYVRFFRSFNYDYLRKWHPDAEPLPWESWQGEAWYPFVDVSLEPGITTVVGANESGKSQLLDAIKRALTGEQIERRDFCRYSRFFAVDSSMSVPEFGMRFSELSEEDRDALDRATGETLPRADTVTLIRTRDGAASVYVDVAGPGWMSFLVADYDALAAAMPAWFEIDSKIPLPTSVPIAYLRSGDLTGIQVRNDRIRWVDRFLKNRTKWFGTPQAVTNSAPELVEEFATESTLDARTAKQLKLADDLLIKVAGVSRVAFDELENAVADGKEGYANGLIDQINESLSKALNFTKYWSQDRDFRLKLTLRDRDVVFTVKDRTGTEYSFNERSGGLQYFLSYLVQYLRHDFSSDAQQVLLMDEPDAYLSSNGQRDLLRIFEGFAYPESSDHLGCQLVYVTHSPFLIDKNHGERIRVLEKGTGDEGTRVVRNAARNHYEPLRSAFGGFVAETAFIGNCNLFVEGTSDQVLIAGMSAWLRKNDATQLDNIDLNSLTLVAAGGASHIPYLAYLARGRDVDRPAVLVLLDSDAAGGDARTALARGGARGKQVVAPRYVLQLAELPAAELSLDTGYGIVGIEDLIPVVIAVAAGKRYVAEYDGADAAANAGTVEAGIISVTKKATMFGAVEAALAAAVGEGFHLDKIGFARSVIEVLPEVEPTEVRRMEQNFRCLFRELALRQRQAEREQHGAKASDRIKREIKSFNTDHPVTATREEAQVLIEVITDKLDGSLYDEAIRLKLKQIAHHHMLHEDPTSPVQSLEEFLRDLNGVAYEELRLAQDAAAAGPKVPAVSVTEVAVASQLDPESDAG
jgi:predicted ATPase